MRKNNEFYLWRKKPPILYLWKKIENIEKLTLRWIFQAVSDFDMEAYEIFLKSPDSVKDIAKDITRELLDRLPGFNVQQRICGTVEKFRLLILKINQSRKPALCIPCTK